MLTADEVRRLEPEVRCAAGLLSPSTGIIDVREYLLALIAYMEESAGDVVYRSSVERVDAIGDGFIVSVQSDGETNESRCDRLLNCAGLSAVGLVERIHGYPPTLHKRM
jgi:L-2-hydroxyglutarate oxidase LhgO